jgi:hypothetical protein
MPEVGATPQVNRQPNLEPVPASGPAKGNRSYISIVIGVLAVAVVALAIWIGFEALTSTSTIQPTTTNINSPSESEIKNEADLQKLEDEVNNSDIDGLTKDLDQNDTDAAEF